MAKKFDDPILRKYSDRRMDGQTDGQTDGQMEKRDFIGRYPTNIERPKITGGNLIFDLPVSW